MAKSNTTSGRKAPKAPPIVATEPEAFGPAIKMEAVSDLEDAATTAARGQQRRIMLMVMSKGAEELAKISEQNPDVYREMREMIHAFLPHARALAEFAQSAATRLMLTDLREDTSKEDAEAMELLKEGGAA